MTETKPTPAATAKVKPLWKSKTFATGIVSLATGLIIALYPAGELSWPGFEAFTRSEVYTPILIGLASIFGRNSIQTLLVEIQKINADKSGE